MKQIVILALLIFVVWFVTCVKLPIKSANGATRDVSDEKSSLSSQSVYNVDDFPLLYRFKPYWKAIRKEAANIKKISKAQRAQDVWVHDTDAMESFIKDTVKDNDEWIPAWKNGDGWQNYPLIMEIRSFQERRGNFVPYPYLYWKN